MKPHYSIAVFCIFLLCAIACSTESYLRARRDIQSDMTQALQLTLAQQQEQWITPDTIRNYRSHLKIAELRSHSFVSYEMAYRGLSSDTVVWNRNGRRMAYRSYADCSPLTVLAVSDQRWSALFWGLAFLWVVASLGLQGARSEERLRVGERSSGMQGAGSNWESVGSLNYDGGHDCFLNAQSQPIRFTPMQQQLMQMFFQAEDHRLSKQEICDELWPKKPDASDTLYTLIRRLKPVVAQNSNLEIVSDRGRAYQLTVKESTE